jgi:hypothetical protein
MMKPTLPDLERSIPNKYDFRILPGGKTAPAEPSAILNLIHLVHHRSVRTPWPNEVSVKGMKPLLCGNGACHGHRCLAENLASEELWKPQILALTFENIGLDLLQRKNGG